MPPRGFVLHLSAASSSTSWFRAQHRPFIRPFSPFENRSSHSSHENHFVPLLSRREATTMKTLCKAAHRIFSLLMLGLLFSTGAAHGQSVPSGPSAHSFVV